MPEKNNPVNIWNNILDTVMKMPGATIDRVAFIEKEFNKYDLGEDIIENAIQLGTGKAGIPLEIMDKVAKGCINYHASICTATSTIAGLPGGWALAGTIPADLAQFYYHVIIIAQKLAYTYGWIDFHDDNSNDDFLASLTLFIGVMTGARGAGVALSQAAKAFAEQVAKRLPRVALTKTAIYPLIKQIAKWLGIGITKESFAKGLAKIIPVLGGVLSGAITAAMFLPMANKLKKQLRELPLANNKGEYDEN